MNNRFLYYCSVAFLLMFSNVVQGQICTVNAGSPRNYCSSDRILLDGTVSTLNSQLNTVLWTVVSQPSGAAAQISNPNSAIAEVTGTLPTGSYTFQLQMTCTDNSVTSQQVTHVITGAPSLPFIISSPPYGFCYTGGGINVTATSPGAGETAVWSYVNGTQGIITNSTSPTVTFEPTPPATNCLGSSPYVTYLKYSVSNSSGCSNSTTYALYYYYGVGVVYVNAIPNVTCSLCSHLYASCSLDGSGVWTYTGPGTATFTGGVNNPITPVCVSTPGVYTFRWTVTGGCRPGTDVDTVNFLNFGTGLVQVDAGPSMHYCDMPSAVSLNGSPLENGQTGLWTQVNGLPVTISNPNVSSTTVTGLQVGGGPYMFAWEVAGEECTIHDTVSYAEKPDWNFITQYNTSMCTPGYIGGDEAILVQSDYYPMWGFDTLSITVTPIVIPDALANASGAVNVDGALGIFNSGFGFVSSNSLGSNTVTFGSPFTWQLSKELLTQLCCGGLGLPQSQTAWNNFLNIQLFMPTGPNLYPGQYQFNVSITDGCNTYNYIRETFINGTPNVIPNAGTDVLLPCGITSAQLSGNPLWDPTRPWSFNYGHFKGMWSMVSGPSASPFITVNPYQQQPIVSGLSEGTYVFRYAYQPTQTCPVQYDDMTLVVNLTPPNVTAALANAGGIVCSGGPAYLSGTIGSNALTGQWSQVSPLAPPATFSPSATSPNVTVSNLSPSTMYTFKWKVTNACSADSALVSFTTGASLGPTAANINPSTACLTTQTFYNATADPLSVGVGVWSVLQEPSPGTVSFSNPNSNNTTINNIVIDGLYKFLWTVTNPPCPTVAQDTLVIGRGTPSTPNAGEDIVECSVPSFPHTIGLNGNTITNGTGRWEFFSGPTAVTFSNAASPTSNVTLPMEGYYTLVWISSYGGCNEIRDYMNISAYQGAPFAHAGTDQTRCGGANTFALDALDLAPGQVGVWTIVDVSSGAFASLSSITNPNATLTLTSSSRVILRWSTFSNSTSCPPNVDEVVVTWVNPSAGADMNVCDVTSVMLVGNQIDIPGVATQWTAVPNTVSFSSPTNYLTAVSGLNPGSYTFTYAVTLGACSASDALTVNIDDFIQADAGADQTVCGGGSVLLSGNNVSSVADNSFWARASGPNSGTFSVLTDSTATYGALTGGNNYVFQYTVENGVCSSTDAVIVTANNCGTVGNYVWADLNGDGLNNEPASAGINGITVELWNATTNTLVSSTTTANNGGNAGYYLFTIPTSGDYYVKFPTANGGSTLSPQTTTAGTDGNSDASVTTGQSPTFTINVSGTGVAKDNMTIDAGYQVPTSCVSVASFFTDIILGFDGTLGTSSGSYNNSGSGLDAPYDMAQKGNEVYVPSSLTNEVFRYSIITGYFIDKFVPVAGNGGLNNAKGITFDLAGDLYVSSGNDIRKYNGTTGAYLGVFAAGSSITSGIPSMGAHMGLKFGSDGHLYVADNGGNRVLKFNGTTGAFMSVFATAPSGSGVRDITFGPDGHLYVGYHNTDKVAKFNGTTGAFIGDFVTAGLGGLDGPTEVTFGLDGLMYVGSLNTNQVLRYNPSTGAFIDVFTSVNSPKGILFKPGICFEPVGTVGNYVWTDTNGNGLQDEAATSGMNGIAVELWNATTNTLVTSTTTANDGSGNAGYYNFVVAASGDYYVKFPTTSGSYILTTQTTTAGTDGNSDANVSSGQSPTFTIDVNGTGVAKDNMTIDAGFTCPGGCIPINVIKH